jgi:hypothetical protein
MRFNGNLHDIMKTLENERTDCKLIKTFDGEIVI